MRGDQILGMAVLVSCIARGPVRLGGGELPYQLCILNARDTGCSYVCLSHRPFKSACLLTLAAKPNLN